MPSLDTLLSLIRTQGIPVGAAEQLRLQQILSAQPPLSGAEFRELLGTVLAKNEDQRQRIAFIFERFTRDLETQNTKQTALLDSEISSTKATAQPNDDKESTRTTRSHPKQQKNYLPWTLAALGIITLTLLLAFLGDKPEIKSKKTVIPVNKPTTTPTKLKVDYQPKPQDKPLIKDLPVWSIEKITVTSRSITQEFIPPFLLFLGSTAGFLWLFSKTLQRTRQRVPESISYQQVTGYHTPPVKHTFYKLFNARDRQTLSWGVGHYFEQNQQQRIDIERSVHASANEGFPVVAFEQSRYEREVWIWQDRLNQSPIQSQMIREIKQVLDQANIHVKHGFFNGTPYQIIDSRQQLQYQVIGALPQPVPLVLLCFDANNVNAHFRQSPNETAQVFQHLKQWSTLAVVDCNPAVSSLKQTLKDYRIPHFLPAQVADWFARQGVGQLRRKVCVLDDVYRWACACSLAQRIITEDEAYALHEALGLNCAWQYSHLKTYGRAVGAGLDFSNAVIERVNDLTEDDRLQALLFWRSRFKQIDQELTRGKDYPNWKNSHSRYTDVKIPIALLGLWESSPEAAINALHDYSENDDLKTSVRQSLARYRCNGLTEAHTDNGDNKKYIQLPFEWESLAPQVQQQLLSMGFAGHEKKLTLQPDTVSSLFMACLVGLLCYALVQCALVLMDKPPVVQTRLDSATPPMPVEYNKENKIYLGTAGNTLENIYKLVQKK